MAQAAFAATIVAGIAKDAVSGAPLVGAGVAIKEGGITLGSAVTGADGSFRLSIDVGVSSTPRNLKIFVTSGGYAARDRDLVVVAGRSAEPSYKLELIPSSISACIRPAGHAVVVGHFRPPLAASSIGADELADRVAETLNYDLLTRIQQGALRPESQPSVRTCGDAKPQASDEHGNFAKALNADAFLSGYVRPDGTNYKVEMRIADRFGVLTPPALSSNPAVNLDDPAAARLDRSAHEAILRALIAGYESAGHVSECVELTVAAERILGNLPQAIRNAREACQTRLPNRGLLRP